MNSIEHYFENLLTMGSDIKGEPNKNALSREVQEAVEICADYVKYDLLSHDAKADFAAILTELKSEIDEMQCLYVDFAHYVNEYDVSNLIQQKINALKGVEDGNVD